MALFFLLLILFLPLNFTFCSVFDIKNKTLSAKNKLFNLILIFNKKYHFEKLAFVDQKGKKVNFFKKDKKIDIKTAFKLKKIYLIYICNLFDDKYYFDTIFNIFDYFFNINDENFRFYLKNNSKLKIIACEGIIYTSIAKIIFTTVFSLGVNLWKVVKTKLKKS